MLGFRFWHCVLIFIALGIVACSANRIEETRDNSIDYQNARELPPLKKASPGGDSPYKSATQPTEAQILSTLAAELIRQGKDRYGVRFGSPLAEIWDSFNRLLVARGVTIHQKSINSNRIFIGCGDLLSTEKRKKRRRWFRKTEKLTHCALEFTPKRRHATVKLIDRSTREITGEPAKSFFQSLLSADT